MYILISVTRDDLTINESFYKTKAEAIDGMIADIICLTNTHGKPSGAAVIL